MKVLLLFLVWLVTLNSACSSEPMKADQIEKMVLASLQKGDSKETIIKFLENHGWPYGYSRVLGHFSTRHPEEKNKQFGYQVYIYVDEREAFDRVEVKSVSLKVL